MSKLFLKIQTCFVVILVLLPLVLGFKNGEEFHAKCQPMDVVQCRSIDYNVTGLPNMFGHKNQIQVEQSLRDITMLLTSTCAEPVRFFFCSMYAPMCSKQTNSLITTCGSLCTYVTKRCKPTAMSLGIPWLKEWNCSQFYWRNNRDEMCMEGSTFNFSPFDPSTNVPATEGTKFLKNVHSNNVRKSSTLRCHSTRIFTKDDQEYAEVWMTVWSIVCFVSTSIALLAFIFGRKKYRYPERCIVILAMCYNLHCVGYIVRVIVGYSETACVLDENSELLLTKNKLGNPRCAIVFLFLYFFGMAACVWWVILTLTWFLAAGMRWSFDAIENYTNVFHLIAWVLPALKAAVVLILRKVDGDELTGLCYVGNQDLLALTGFVLGPQFTYLITGVLFLLAGFVAVYRMKFEQNKQRLHGVEKFDVVLFRIGIFAGIICLPASCMIGIHFYEYNTRDKWAKGESGAYVTVLMMKISASVFAGLLCSFWLWTYKIIVTMKSFFKRKFPKENISENNQIALRNLTVNGFQTDADV
ncbi:frizzled-4-like [Xenia sp. Carnegie-2017]|uniref:frizzled-4-like n=1 Tax=Xenia sp. Carnegie-2017 TaxID=2897299 RepID=UPI001F0370AE|nr:frizzled-4-like [Xenia sp. Carnegie-2017]